MLQIPKHAPTLLAKAHAELDRAVDRCYRSQPFESDRHRVEFLFALYEHLTAPLAAAMATRKSKRKPRATNSPPVYERKGIMPEEIVPVEGMTQNGAQQCAKPRSQPVQVPKRRAMPCAR